MPARTSTVTVTFRHPFRLASLDDPLPAGSYRVEIDEDEVHGLSFVAYRRAATTLHTPALSAAKGPCQALPVTAEELATALAADAAT
jgi:hypothetical protein